MLLMMVSLLAHSPIGAQTELAVAASILPVHSLVSAVTRGVSIPHLILPANASPHLSQLRPSQARALHNADVVFWIGPSMETFLARAISGLAPETQVSTLMRAPGVRLLPFRAQRIWDTSDDFHADVPVEEGEHFMDSHIWLSPYNAAQMIAEIVRVLSQLDATNRQRYQHNGNDTLARITALDQELTTTLGEVRHKPFVVFHDAHRYFEDHYDLSPLAALTANPELAPSAKRVVALQKTIRDHAAVCVFVEPQHSVAWLTTMSAGEPIRMGVLDPLGSQLAPGEDAYFNLMRTNAKAIIECLSD